MKKMLQIALIAIGILSIILSTYCFNADIGRSESSENYGGDAYTGIQNAAAQTANNVKELAWIVSFGTGSCLLIGGLTLIVSGAMLLLRDFGTPIDNTASNANNTGCVAHNTVSVKNEERKRDFDIQNNAKLMANGGWKCSCGRVNPSYTSSCACGKSKFDME